VYLLPLRRLGASGRYERQRRYGSGSRPAWRRRPSDELQVAVINMCSMSGHGPQWR
jgi:hypothetical protein